MISIESKLGISSEPPCHFLGFFFFRLYGDPYSYLAHGDWVLKWGERTQLSNWYGNFHYAGAQNKASFWLKSKAILTSFPRWIFLKICSLLGFSCYSYSKNLRENYTWTTAINGKNENCRNWPNVCTELIVTLRGDTWSFSFLYTKTEKFYRVKSWQTRFEII